MGGGGWLIRIVISVKTLKNNKYFSFHHLNLSFLSPFWLFANLKNCKILIQKFKAAELTVKFLADTDEGMNILSAIGQRQMELRQFLAAGETFLLANRPAESIEVDFFAIFEIFMRNFQALLEAHEWGKAKRVREKKFSFTKFFTL